MVIEIVYLSIYERFVTFHSYLSLPEAIPIVDAIVHISFWYVSSVQNSLSSHAAQVGRCGFPHQPKNPQ